MFVKKNLWRYCGALFLISSLSVISSCSNKPPCSNQGVKMTSKSSSCLLVHENQALVVKLLGGRVALVEDAPKRRENALCAAERAVWDQAGLHVQVQSKLAEFEDGEVLFSCVLLSDPLLKSSKAFGVVSIDWVPVTDLEDLNWQNHSKSLVMLGHL